MPSPEPDTHVHYLAYGSNLNRSTFEGRRGIKPLSATPVSVPTLTLTFSLPGIAYLEPRFANVQPVSAETSTLTSPPLIGVVYKVTLHDYTTIIATEGGGASYEDVLVDCYPLDGSGASIKAHTLLAPMHKTRNAGQPSARYLRLIIAGAEQQRLPDHYRKYLGSFRPYRITSVRQRVGALLFTALWAPAVMVLLVVLRLLSGENGRSPGWLARLNKWLFEAMWWSYDVCFRRVFGDGEMRRDGC